MPWLVGAVGRTGGNRIITEVTLVFLDAELREQPADLTGLLSKYGKLTVHEVGE